ncbi:metal ABC transporter substrate-binding protein [Blastococcus sp. Marseille-P5729]|uniref:metal ABC transporter substrate-binding protein n=1 Tax=Blastococcus sp. Marseille-P5729 TaxID=2086582 RepID=UPI000D10B90C|nr:metal ABC transporter substrate-binding protein [Blastococcus sp. Marseille-P5729]
MLNSRRSRRFRLLIASSSIGLAGLSLAACSSDSGSGSDGDKVVVGFYPLEYLATEIGGEQVEVQSLAQQGADPHDMELNAQEVGAISSASLVIHLKGLQPAVDDAIENESPEHVLDVATVTDLMPGSDDLGHSHGDEDHAAEEDHSGHDHGDESGDDHAGHDHGDALDPHIWLDPELMSSMAEAVKDHLVEIDPDHEEDYESNYEALNNELSQLDQDFTTGLAQCERTAIVTTHNAFGYLAKAYGLQQVGIAGLTDEDPSPQKLAEVKEFVEQNGITTIFYESGSSDKYAETVSQATGAQAGELNPLENQPESGDYLSAMKDNLAALQAALGCS